MIANTDIAKAMEIHLGALFDELPPMPDFVPGIRRAPSRHFNLSRKDTELALKNALRYIPGQVARDAGAGVPERADHAPAGSTATGSGRRAGLGTA